MSAEFPRIGQGWDRHRLADGRPCRLGGVLFADFPRGPLGHSDGDVVCHAVIDAVLGAAALGDIGTHFPDTDPTWQGADSLDLVTRTRDLLHRQGFTVLNVDCTIIAEQPLIRPQVPQMRRNLAEALDVAADRVSVKATRGEGVGPEGRGECITVTAVALVAAAGDA